MNPFCKLAGSALALGLLLAFPADALLPRQYEAQSGREALEASQKSGKPIMIYFSQPNCGWCVVVEKLLATSEARLEFLKHFHFVNVELGANTDPVSRALQQMFKVNGTPAFAFLSAKGEPICLIYGTIKDDAELARIDRNVHALARGATGQMTSRGYPSCRGEVTEDDSRVTSSGRK